MQKHFEYLIVGQGLAGTLVAWFLEQAGKTFIVIDKHDVSSSSYIAAGIIHPITGRRLVKSWRADDLIPFAEQTYKTIGEKFDTLFYHRKPILELFTSVKHRNDWQTRSGEAGMDKYCGDELAPFSLPGIELSMGGICIKQSGYLMIKDFLDTYRLYLLKTNALINESILFDKLQITQQAVKWNSIEAKNIIFCEGYSAQSNPYFSWLPFIPAKGEILSIEAPELSEDFILNRSLYILPCGNNFFKVGATHEWNTINAIPTSEARDKMVRLLSEMISVPYTIIEQFAGVRPTVKDRRPFIGSHPKFSHVHLFNGLGTKGVMLAPWFANHFVKSLTENQSIDEEVNINRFL